MAKPVTNSHFYFVSRKGAPVNFPAQSTVPGLASNLQRGKFPFTPGPGHILSAVLFLGGKHFQ